MSLRTCMIIWVVAGVLTLLSLPAVARGDTAAPAKQLSLFDLSIVELMNVEINVPPATLQSSGSACCKPLSDEASVSTEMDQAASSHDAAEPGIPSLPVRQPAKSDVR
jgi:hypothetical protein